MYVYHKNPQNLRKKITGAEQLFTSTFHFLWFIPLLIEDFYLAIFFAGNSTSYKLAFAQDPSLLLPKREDFPVDNKFPCGSPAMQRLSLLWRRV